jgi:cholesterol transport system auxiliary component
MGSRPAIAPAARCRLPVALGGLALLAACFGGPAPRDHFYRPAPPQPSAALSKPALPGTLEVERLRSDALTRERSILHADSAGSVQVVPYSYELWIDTPTVMLQRELAAFLRRAGVAERVVLPEMNVRDDFVLGGWVERMVYVTGSDSVLLELDFSLSRARGGGQILQRRYRVERPVGGHGMDAVVAAFSAAMQDAFEQLVADIAATAH